MKHAARTLAFIARFVVLGLAVAFIIGLFWPGSGAFLRQRFTAPAGITATTTGESPTSSPVSYADAVAKAAPSVVNIYANKMVTEQPRQLYSDPVLQRIFSVPTGPARTRRQQNLGSGVIVSDDGYVLTNNHVIANADDIQLLLYDGRVAKARVVGSDDETDLAVLKVDAGNLPAIHMTDPDRRPRVGDVVLAIGNPFGIGQTVTMGIVSAIGRQLNLSSLENFIQTDAAINFGNSGGALVNAHGELVGINTSLIGQAVGAEGIGFAIPVASARNVLDQIVQTGHVVRGWIGADYGVLPISADSGLPSAARGVVVNDVSPGGPAAIAGIQQRDVLLKIGGEDILDPSDLRRREASFKPGTAIEVSGLRSGAPFTSTITPSQRPPTAPMQALQTPAR
ncbi:peptidase S1 [Luteibacter rhizovicinus DSM 16549]|uniref:Peptidase S1 n=1 Tax=Luteibacter rhizovicinus DSM 16549 TaxID=1440763 RepID=A0A0G9HEX0_9GAMM|nr:trypsin-like peptidase domain-containing protein [Luteibacter rhizovicinus]APG04744.1 peptidase S1 [Luteibacter rhizovicinus DSM 16549]KLD68233.1 peptidase S1 [Luteibacter rhizovicinus DSM 16549]KLD78859.1 peptidase S1 [Xanthomonas hyacinthi DSM 19077]